MSTDKLYVQLSFTGLAIGASATLTHGLKLNGTALVPDVIFPQYPTSFEVTAATTTQVTLRNTANAAGSCIVHCYAIHPVMRMLGMPADDGTMSEHMTPQPFVLGSPNAGGSTFPGYADTSVMDFGATGDGVTDDGPAIQRASDATQGLTLYFPPPAVGYRVNSSLQISSDGHHWLGNIGARRTSGGSQIIYYGTGPCIQIGTDNGHPWNAKDYDGFQETVLENLCITHGAPDTALASTGTSDPRYKAGAYGIWDWRGGSNTFRNLRIEAFEANFVGIQSDICLYEFCTSLYSKYGWYLGPRSDQVRILLLYSFFCDRSITIDGATNTTVYGGVQAFCGTGTSSPYEIRMGSAAVNFHGNWCENSGEGFAGTMPSMWSVGEVQGYGAGGSIQSPGPTPTTTPVSGFLTDTPLVYPLPPGPSHTKYIAAVGFCNQFELRHPTTPPTIGLSTLDALVAIQAGFAPTATDTQIVITGAPDSLSRAQCFLNLGGGPVTATIENGKSLDGINIGLDTSATTIIRGTVTQSAPANSTAYTLSNSQPNQTVGLVLYRLTTALATYDTTGGAIFPVAMVITDSATRAAGAASVGKTGLQIDVLNGQTNTALITVRGDVHLNSSSGLCEIAQALYLSNEITPAAVGADQTDWNPPGLANASLLIATSTVSILVNSLVINGNLANGRDLLFWNGNASGSGLNITLVHESGLGTAAQRFIGDGYANVVLAPGKGARLHYSTAKSRILTFAFA